MKQKLFFTLIITFISISNIYSQTTIDIVRASNYYSKAVGQYQSGSYSSTLNSLKEAETNLKGKTNKDLEYLKIMTYYKLKNYEKAYSLVKTYFETGYSQRTQYFKNVETLREKNNTSYDEDLTSIFIDLENKYGVVSNTSIDEVITSIVKRIKEKKRSRENIIINSTYEEVKISSRYYEPIDSYNNLRTGTVVKRYGEKRNTYWFTRSISSNIIKYNNSSYSWYKKFMFDEDFYVNSSYYEYDYNISNTSTYISKSDIKLKYPKNWYNHSWGRSSHSEMKESIYSGLKSKSHNDDFLKDNDYGKFTISFTETEKLVLQQQGNLDKLKKALKEASLY